MKKILEEVKDAVIYQINLRVFTKEGTFVAAEKFLPDLPCPQIALMQILHTIAG